MSIFNNEYSSNIGKQLTWIIFLLVMTVMLMLAFPIINDPSVSPIIINTISNIPESVINVFFSNGLITFENLPIYFDSILIFIQFMVCIFAFNIGSISLAKEQGFGTIDYMYINPVTRNEIVIKKTLANILSLLFLTIIMFLISTYAYSYVAEIDFISSLKEYFLKFTVIFLEGLLFLSLGVLISSFAKKTVGLSYISTIIFVLVLALNILISIKIVKIPVFLEGIIPLRTLQILNFNDLFQYSLMLIVSKILPTIIFITIALLNYNRKDLIVW